MSASRALLDGRPAAALPFSDRGLRYGDGLFETLRVAAGEPVWWDLHMARLARGCAALGIAVPAQQALADEARALSQGEDGVLRLLVTRGDGPRGYAPAGGDARRLLLFDPGLPAPRAPLQVGWGTLALGVQPRLAGCKHLNRLEQVLAAQECAAAGLDELLLLDSAGAVTSGIAGNLFVVRAGQLLTPLLDRCGVAGTCRAWLLSQCAVQVARLSRADVEAADELFLCNSLRGILPVARLAGRAFDAPGAVTAALMARLAREVPSLAKDRSSDG